MVFCVPVIAETDFIMHLWLVNVPTYAVEFVQVILFLTLIESFSQILIHLLLATGNIKKYQLLVGGVQLLNFPIAYILLKFGFSPVSTVGSTIVISIICLFIRLYLLKSMMDFPVKQYFKQVILKSMILLALSLILPTCISSVIDYGWMKFIINIVVTELVMIAIVLTIGLTSSEKKFILNKIPIIKNVLQ